MKRFLPVLLLFLVSCSHTYYVVRHAEKEAAVPNMMSTDVSLSDKGKQRAEALKQVLRNKKIKYIFSTNTIRTRSTAQPLADQLGLKIETYGPVPDSAFINKLRAIKKNVLIVGHSNTVDNIVNMLCKRKEVPGDLPDSAYSKLFIVTVKGKNTSFREEHIPSHN